MKKLKMILKNYLFVFKIIYQSSKWIFILSIVSTIVMGILPTFESVLLKKIIVLIENFYNADINSSHKILWYYAIIYVGTTMIKDVIADCRIAVYRIAGFNLAYNIQSKVIEKLRTIEYYMFYKPEFQNLYTFVLENSAHEPFEIMRSILFILSMIIELISLISILVYFNVWFVLILIIAFMPNIIYRFKLQKENVEIWEIHGKNNRQVSYYFGLMTEKLSVKETREYGLYDYFYNKRKEKYDDNISMWIKFGKKEFKTMSSSQLISKMGILLVYIWLILNVLAKKYNISDFVFYSGIIFSFHYLYSGLIENLATHYTSILFMRKFFEFMSIKEDIVSGSKLPCSGNHTLEFKNVWFRYKNTDKYVLKNINFKLKTRDRVCIIGKNGCGKSTLINLILRNYDPTSGNILLDGVDIKEYDIVKYRSIFSSINQDNVKYCVSIKDTISFGSIDDCENITKVKSAAKRAIANKFIESLEKKYESKLTKNFYDDGVELSGGQWQKLSIARVFFSKADILIFDEPTSALDPEAEAKIYEEIEKDEDNKIKIFISHRMYSSKSATKIIMLQNGKILDIGNHNELILRNKNYREIFNLQAIKYTSKT